MKYCIKCGAKFDGSTMLCPMCDAEINGSSPYKANDNSRVEEESEDVTYSDPYIEEVVKKGKNPICGRASVGLLLGALALWVIMGLKSAGSNVVTAAAVTLALFPLVLLLFAGALALAIVSKVRKERGSSANITICSLILCVVYYVINIIAM